MSVNTLKQYGQPLVYRLIHPLVQLLVWLKISPNTITTIGFVLNIAVSVIFIVGAGAERTNLAYLGWGGAMILFAGLFDMIDGRLARLSNRSTQFGALYDSVLDRYSELIMFLGITYYLVAQNYFLSSLFAFIAMIGSIMVSYVRARAEGLGIACSDGLMQRPERILTIGISAVACSVISYFTGTFKYFLPGIGFPVFENITIFVWSLAALAVLSNYTAIDRLLSSKKALQELERKKTTE
ncbi:CDP-alcohol phosphatidyltransferase family protein [Sphingobacteriales bacterium UPWRP_1]|nr:CDP-diacylglycerol--inositol 3-phosphatidyltransferase [Sphingobacteriales bacterium TSM_CSS]PSJ76808.1 CDP-alcohol phosphatidyltransferase family protein [Sphingobacteriales bacterium UPWRP_1]